MIAAREEQNNDHRTDPAWPWPARLCVALTLTTAAAAQTYGFATMQPGTLNHTTGTAIAKVAKEKAGLNALVQPTAGESVIIPLVGRGEAEFGIANALEVSVAVENNRLPELRLIGAIHPLPTAYFVRKDTTMRTIADLKGKKVVFGLLGAAHPRHPVAGASSPPAA